MRHPCLTWWPEKFFGDTAHVSPEAAAFYMVLLSHAWMRGGSLPNDDAALRNMTRVSRQKWHAIRAEVMSFWTLEEDGRWHQKRLDVEWSKASEKHVAVQRASHKVDDLNGKTRDRLRAQKVNKNNGQQFSSARARDPTPTPTKKDLCSLPEQRDLSLAAPASLRVLKAHASPALRVITNTEPSPPPDDGLPAKFTDEQRARMAAAANRVIAEIAAAKLVALGEVPTGEVCAGTKAEIERKAAEEKLAALAAAAEKPMLALSPITRASRLLVSAGMA